MGAARRVDDDPRDWLATEPRTSEPSEPEVELGFGDWEIEETDPWCVDDGASIVVMRTRDIQQRLRRGGLGRDVKVWRDGRACWLPVDDVYELRSSADETQPSRIRRIRRPTPTPEDRTSGRGKARENWWRRTMLMIFGGVTLGIVTIMLLAPRARVDAQLEPAAANVIGAAAVVMARR
jgi:hypothetical protein